MARKRRTTVPKILWTNFGKRARDLENTILYLIPDRNIQPEQCRCRGQGCIRCIRDKLSFLSRLNDPSGYRKLLHSCFVVLHEQAPPLLDFSPKCWWSQREIVEKVIEMMDSGNAHQNVICARYDKYNQSSPILELLTSESWEFLLSRVGHDFMTYLLQHTSIFLPCLQKKHQQVAGPPLCIQQKETLSVHNNKRKRDDKVQPSKKRQHLSSAFNGDCRNDSSAAGTSRVGENVCQHQEDSTTHQLNSSSNKVDKPHKRFRLYLKQRKRQRWLNSQTVGNETPCITPCINGEPLTGHEAVGRNRPSRNGMCTDPAKQAKEKKHFKSDISEFVSVIPPKHILKTLRPNCSDAKFLINHIFGEVNAWSTVPIQAKGKCLCASICLYHSCVQSFRNLIRKARSPHLKKLLDRHCPQEEALKFSDINSQSSSAKETTLSCTKHQVVSFIGAICRHIVPETMLGTSRQKRRLMSNIAWFVSRRKREECTVIQFLHRLKLSDFPFFANKELCCLVKRHELPNESIRSTQQMLCSKWISWLFVEIVKKLVPFNFYVTDSQEGKLNVTYYRKSSWQRSIRKQISENFNGYTQVQNVEAEGRSRTTGLSKFRFLPKENGMRMLLDFRSSSRLQSFRDTHAVLKDIQLKEPNTFGSSLFNHDEFYRKLGSYVTQLKMQYGDIPRLYFVVADVFKAFDSINQDKLLQIVRCVMKDEYIFERCKLVSCGKKSQWSNTILISSNKFSGHSRLTSTFPFNPLQSFMVDQGENHRVSKKDVMVWIEKMLKNNMVQLDNNFYVQTSGIPQGHRLSSLLCSLYYGHLETTLIYPFLKEASRDVETNLSNLPSYNLVRYMDDYLFVSTSEDQATSFYQRLKHGFEDYNCFMNEKKFCLNFKGESESGCSSQNMYVGGNGVHFIKWTGLLINSRTSEVQVDYTRYLNCHVSSTFSVAWENKPVSNLWRKLCYFLVPKCHPIFFDSNINSGGIVRLNIYQIFLLAAMKFHCYVYELSRFWKLDPQHLFKFITKSIRYLFRLIRRRMYNFNTGSSFRPILQLCKNEVIWLGLHAFIQVLKKKQSRHRKLLVFLRSAFFKHNLSQNLSPELQYATDRLNSSSLWKLKY